EFSKSIVAAADEVCVRAETDTKVQSFSLSEFNTAAAKKLTDLSDAKQVECLVLRDHDRAVNGFCILFCDTTPVRQLQDIGATLIGSYYEIYRKAKPGFVGRLLIAYRQAVRQRKLINIGLPILLAALLLMLPVPLKVKTNCTVQPETKRYISAPYEGRLEEVLVEPGDVVRKGDVLARMDARDIRWQLGVVEADYNQARRQWDAAMAPGSRDTSAAQIASFEMERLELKRNLLQDRIMNLDIKSPADGVVISGDPKKLEGARLTMGQTLAEVGPLDENMFELEIPDSDISYVNPGDVVRIKLHSMPGKTLTGSLDLIHPRAEQRGDKNVFIGDVRIDAAIDMENLRPGMKGTARITGPKCRLGWNLFHKSWEQVLFRIGW
ncbi:MAG: efflux RND transporter periplasmic adaptor subunit, partial [Planctomycetales bacterium]|nr:efflux RND transporter periplasmic adaptor subunit [Planctomycetales bacterium]